MRVLQVFRAPLGGLFRHVADLTRGLVENGAEVGIVCSTEDGGALSNARLAELEHLTALGLHRVAMPRLAGWPDVTACRRVAALAREYDADVIHGHGAKGGLYARAASVLCGRGAAYTPHGGSLHYDAKSPSGFAYISLEKLLGRLGGTVIFESEYSARAYREKIGEPGGVCRVVHNGLAPAEFAPVAVNADAADVLFIGEMRDLKGVAVLLDAIGKIRQRRTIKAIFVGSGPDRASYEARAAGLGLSEAVRFTDPMPARQAFGLARLVVVPSLAESLPYIVLEAIAAGRPIVATKVGGIPEIFGPLSIRLVEPGDAEALAHAIETRLGAPDDTAREASELRDHVKLHFNAQKMVAAIHSAYWRLLERNAPTASPREARNSSL